MKQEKRSRIVRWMVAGLFTATLLASGFGFSLAEHSHDAETVACIGPCSDPGNGGG